MNKVTLPGALYWAQELDRAYPDVRKLVGAGCFLPRRLFSAFSQWNPLRL